jgi:hypothetical protein
MSDSATHSGEVPYLWRARYPEDTVEGPIDMLLLPIEGEGIQSDDDWETTIVTWESKHGE